MYSKEGQYLRNNPKEFSWQAGLLMGYFSIEYRSKRKSKAVQHAQMLDILNQ